MRVEHLVLISHCQISALVERTGSIAWCCLPGSEAKSGFSALPDHLETGLTPRRRPVNRVDPVARLPRAGSR
jgi:hypothetical protein